MPQRTEIKIKTKIPKRNQTSTHIRPDRLSAPKRRKARQRKRVRAVFFRAATKRTPNRIKFAGPQTNNETHLTLLLSSSDRSPSDAQIRKESERSLSTSRLPLSRHIDRVGLKLKLFLLHSYHDGSSYSTYSRTRHRSC